MYLIGRIEVRSRDKDMKTTVYITDESVTPTRNTNMPLYKLEEEGYKIISAFENRGVAYLILEG